MGLEELAIPASFLSRDNKSHVINGYQEAYRIFSLGQLDASLMAPLYPVKDEKANPSEAVLFPAITEPWTGVVYSGTALIDPQIFKRIHIILLNSAGHSRPLPLDIFQSDVLAGLEAGEALDFLPFYYIARSEIITKNIFSGCLLPLDDIMRDSKGSKSSAKNSYVYMEAVILEAFPITQLSVEELPQLFCLLLDTSFGRIHALAGQIQNMPAKGAYLRCIGHLVGNVACGRYAEGAIYDQASDYRVLAECFAKCEFERSRSLFGPDCQYFARGMLRATGPEEIVEALNKVKEQIRSSQMNYSICYAQISHPECAADAPYRDGQKALGFVNAEDRLTSLICIDTDARGKISRLYTLYDFEEGANVATTDSFTIWQREL